MPFQLTTPICPGDNLLALSRTIGLFPEPLMANPPMLPKERYDASKHALLQQVKPSTKNIRLFFGSHPQMWTVHKFARWSAVAFFSKGICWTS
jgi:hypothetical protein